MISTLNGKNILVTAGSTRGYLDAVRFITNISTGRLSQEIAMEALVHGAHVTYVYGKGSVVPEIKEHSDIMPYHLELIEIETNKDLEGTFQLSLRKRNFDVIVHAMAVADYVPDERQSDKISSEKEELIIKLVKTRKVINIIRNIWPESYLVGFKLVVQKRREDLLQIAQDFLKQSAADLIIANDSRDISDKRHVAYFVCNNLKMTNLFYSKKEIAKGLIHHLEQQVR